AAAASTTRATRGSSDDDAAPARAHPHPAREPAARRPQVAWAARNDRAAVGVVDRRADGHRPPAARAADGQADPLDAEPAAPRAADEGDPEEVQGRQEAPAGRADEVLPREQHQPGLVVPTAAGAVPGLHLALPGAEALPAPA